MRVTHDARTALRTRYLEARHIVFPFAFEQRQQDPTASNTISIEISAQSNEPPTAMLQYERLPSTKQDNLRGGLPHASQSLTVRILGSAL